MTTDMERELRELFREKAEDASLATPKTPATAPRQILRRGRRHQVGTVLGSAAIVLVLIVGSVAGLNAVLRGEGDPFRAGDYKVFERTATIEAFTVGSPSNWYLVNEWPLSMTTAVTGSGSASGECTAAAPGVGQPSPVCTSSEPSPQVESLPYGLPMIQLSNVDMGLNAVSCGQALPANAAVLYMGLDYGRAIFGAKDPTIPEFPPGIGLPPEGDGPCGPGRYANFTVNGEPFFAWIGIGPDVSDHDRETVQNSYEMMSAIPDWKPIPPTEMTPAYVIAGGVTQAGEEWRLELRPSQENVRFSLVGGPAAGTALSDFVIPPQVIEWAATDPIFGAITKQAAAVEFRSKNDPSAAIAGTIVPLPPSMPFDFELFFIEGTAGIDGEAVALWPDGDVIEGDTSVGKLRHAVVELSGSRLGHDWSARFSGAFADRDACIDVRVDGIEDRTGPDCRRTTRQAWAGSQPSLDTWIFTQMSVEAGSVPSDVVGIRFRSDDTTRGEVSGLCQLGPIGWTDHNVCVIALSPKDSGTFEYLDGNGAILFEEGRGWASATAAVAPADLVHGGTYWAVYPWVGAAGSREADDVSAQLQDEFGIVARPGDLGCDQGAAEALGTTAEQGIAVYFETEETANEFARQAGLIGHDAGPVIAHVTTYCLD